MKTHEDIFLLLSLLTDIYVDKAFIKKISSLFNISEVFCADKSSWKNNLKHQEIDKVELLKHAISNININELKKKLNNLQINFIHLNDSRYPEKLKEIHDPPVGLFCKGNIDILNQSKFISIVGTRKSTSYGEVTAKRIAYSFAKRGLIVVSGLADGIDAFAHKGALDSGKTIAVLGTGVDIIFPLANKKLYEDILDKNSLLVSEYPPGTAGLPWNFPQRNRIISGLSDAVVVIEGDIDSGAIITARFAIKHDRLLFALPGPVDSRVSNGPNALIKSGVAELLISENDILEKIGEPVQKSIKFENYEIDENLTKEQKELMSVFSSVSVTVEDLIQKTSMDLSSLSVNLSILELQGHIEKSFDGGFVRKK